VQELEALLTLYLSEHWDSMDLVKKANDQDLREDGLICLLPGAKDADIGMRRHLQNRLL
jgi:hypothetical protein